MKTFISPKACLKEYLCNGSESHPFDNLIVAFKFGWRSGAGEFFYLLASEEKDITITHFINNDDYDVQHLFRRYFADAYIKPLYCSNRNVECCLKNEKLKPIIILLTPSLYFFVTKLFYISDIILDGSQIAIAGRKRNLNENQRRSRFCSEKQLFNESNNQCNLNGKLESIENQESSYSLFNLEAPIDLIEENFIIDYGNFDVDVTRSQLTLKNIEFLFFYQLNYAYVMKSLIGFRN